MDPRLNKTHQTTKQMAALYGQISALGDTRRNVWQDLINEGWSQSAIAEGAGVASHTVYRELRKLREERRNWEKPLKKDLEEISK